MKMKKVIEVLMPSLNPVSDRDRNIRAVAGEKQPPPRDTDFPATKTPVSLVDSASSTPTQSQSSEITISGVAGQKRPPPGDRYLPFPKRPAPLFASTSTSSTLSQSPEVTVSFGCLYFADI